MYNELLMTSPLPQQLLVLGQPTKTGADRIYEAVFIRIFPARHRIGVIGFIGVWVRRNEVIKFKHYPIPTWNDHTTITLQWPSLKPVSFTLIRLALYRKSDSKVVPVYKVCNLNWARIPVRRDLSTSLARGDFSTSPARRELSRPPIQQTHNRLSGSWRNRIKCEMWNWMNSIKLVSYVHLLISQLIGFISPAKLSD